MVPAPLEASALIWATRGRSWGFRFLLDGGQRDPLFAYERAFDGLEEDPFCNRTLDGLTALRFPDPQNRCDSAGRLIPHEFVLLDHAFTIASARDGRDLVWPFVSATYARIWENDTPPTRSAVRLDL